MSSAPGQPAAPSGHDSSGRSADLHVRPAAPEDLAPLQFFFDTALRRDYFVRRGQLAEILEGPSHDVFVAELDAVLVGVAIRSAGCRLINALIHPAYRGLGLGKALVLATGVTEARVKLDMSSGDPRGFYAALGFESTGERNVKGNVEVMRAPSRQRALAIAGQVSAHAYETRPKENSDSEVRCAAGSDARKSVHATRAGAVDSTNR